VNWNILLFDWYNFHLGWGRLSLWRCGAAASYKGGEAGKGDGRSDYLRAYRHLIRSPAWCYALDKNEGLFGEVPRHARLRCADVVLRRRLPKLERRCKRWFTCGRGDSFVVSTTRVLECGR
jgi:hypothetical protein